MTGRRDRPVTYKRSHARRSDYLQVSILLRAAEMPESE